MGKHEGWAEAPMGLLPNGLLPNESASVIRVLDSERWSKAEERTAELIRCIQPNTPSEQRRNAVADYVQRLIMKCFPSQVKVVTFGSVPLKTYLPDGDIDLTAFSGNQNLKETWAHQVRDMLESEENNENAEFRVKEVQYIQAEVKIIKCLVENIVVDISFDQLGGLCTLCFLLEVDHLINQNHLFKRSIILIKAWCYYESRILGAHHGLISTYALETLVLYIFHVFNNSFAGPLEVLYRFLEFFSKFDWENFCVSLWGPVPISSLPDVTAEPPRKDDGELLLNKLFLDACSKVYAVFPGGQENQGQPFISKHFNVIDPLRINNNLGRSVSKGNFFRIRSAFAFGAKRLARLLDCLKEDLYYEVNQFFLNTWDRHGSGCRPDAPGNDLWRLRLSNPDNLHVSENLGNNASSIKYDISSPRDAGVVMTHGRLNVSSQHRTGALVSTSINNDVPSVSHTPGTEIHGNPSNSTGLIRQDFSSNHYAHNDKGQKGSKPGTIVNSNQGKFLFARTRSSPELTDAYSDRSFQGRRNRVPETGKSQTASVRSDNNRRKNLEVDVIANNDGRSATEDPSSLRHLSSHQGRDAGSDPNSSLSSYHVDSDVNVIGEEFASALGTQGMHQEEQDLVNIMASSSGHFSGHVHMPLNLASGHIPLPIPPSILASMGYGHRHLAGMIPTNIPLLDNPWGAHMQIPHGLLPSQFAHYFPGIGLNSNPEESKEHGAEQFGSREVNPVEASHGYWHEQDRGMSGGFDLDNGIVEVLNSDDNRQSTSAGYNFVHSSRATSSGNHARVQQTFRKSPAPPNEDYLETSHCEDNRGDEAYFDDKTVSSRPASVAHATSLRSKTSSESSCEGSSTSSAKALKSVKEKQGRKTASSALPSSAYGKTRSMSEHSSTQADDDNRDWNQLSTVGCEMSEGSIGPESVTSLHVSRHQIPGSEEAQTSGSDSLIPMAPMLLGPGSWPRAIDNSGVVPFTFYPTGPPVPFVTMLPPYYNYQTETSTSDALPNHLNVEEQLDHSDSGQNFNPIGELDRLDVLNTSARSAVSIELLEHKPDILHSDFASHWQNLQYGRFCQSSLNPTQMLYSSPGVPPVYLQGHIPWDGPGRQLTANMNLVSQLMNYGPRLMPVAAPQSVSTRPSTVYEMPRYRSGTGTYLPNPKASSRDRYSSSSRRGNYNHDRNNHHSERDGNWSNAKSRGTGRSHNREKQSSRSERLVANGSRSDRPWGSLRHDSYGSYQSQNGPNRSNPTQSNMAYSMYSLPAMNPGGVSSNGPTLPLPPVVMLYPYDHQMNTSYGSPAEQHEFGSLNEGSRSGVVFEERRFQSGGSAQISSPDQPSSPHLQR